MAVADFAHHTWTRLTRQAGRLSRVCGESNIWCEFCRQASTGQTARKKYQLMQEQQSSALLALLTPSNKTARHRKVQRSWAHARTMRDDAPYIDNIIYVSCAEYDWCTWPGMYYFSMRKPLESEAGNLIYLVRTRSENNNTERVKSGAAG